MKVLSQFNIALPSIYYFDYAALFNMLFLFLYYRHAFITVCCINLQVYLINKCLVRTLHGEEQWRSLHPKR